MSLQPQTYHSQMYRNFRAIDRSEFRRIVRFYERYEKSILVLDFEEYFEMVVVYTQSLFEISEYRKHILMTDVVVKTSILENISHIRGEEIYKSTLFQKAASHYNLREYSKSKHVLCELLKMDPNDSLSIRFIGRVLRDDKPVYINYTRAISIFLFLMAVILVCVQVLIVKPFYTLYDPIIDVSRNSVFGLGVVLLVGGELWHRWRVQVYIRELVKNIKLKKHQLQTT